MARKSASSLRSRSRMEILELLVQALEENETLRQENEQLKKQLESRTAAIEESGTLAEACLKLSGIFEAADRAIALYKENLTGEILESPLGQSSEADKNAPRENTAHTPGQKQTNQKRKIEQTETGI